MANILSLPNLEQTLEAFRAQYENELVSLKVNRNPVRTAEESPSRAVAQWGNLIDGIALVLQDDYAERRVTGRVRVGASTVIRSTVTPNNAVVGSPGDVCVVTNGTAWLKVTGSGTNTGWQQIIAGAADSSLRFFGNGGNVDGDFTDVFVEEDRFVLTDLGNGELQFDLGQIALSNLPAGVDRTLFSSGADAGPSNTTTPTDVLSYSVASNTLSADGQSLLVDMSGEVFNQSGSNRTYVIEFLLGGVALYTATSASMASSTTRRIWNLSFMLTRKSSTTCYLAGNWSRYSTGAAPTVGQGGPWDTGQFVHPIASAASSPTVAWGSSQTLQIRITLSNADANYEFIRRAAHVRRLAA